MQRVNSEILKVIIKEIQSNNKITEKELSTKYYYSERTIRRYVKILKDAGIIKMSNSGKKRSWEIMWWYVQFIQIICYNIINVLGGNLWR